MTYAENIWETSENHIAGDLASASGIVSANADGNGYYIPYYRITSAFTGLTFTYT